MAVLVVGVVLGATLQWFFFTPSYQEVSVPKKAYLAVLVEQKEIPPRCNGLIDALTSWLRNDDGTVDLQEFNDLIDQAWVSVRCKE